LAASPASEAGLEPLLAALAALGEPTTALVVGSRAAPGLRRRAPTGVFFADPVDDLRPLLAAVRLVVIIAAGEAAATDTLRRFVALACGYGKPLLLAAGLRGALADDGLDRDLAALPRFDRPERLWAEASRLLAAPAALAELAATSARIGDRLRARGIVSGGAVAAAAPMVAWGPEIAACNRLVRACFAGGPDGRRAADRLSHELRSRGEGWPCADAVLRALFCDKTAPVLRGEDTAFAALRQSPPATSAAGALALLHAGAQSRDGLLPVLLTSLCRGVRMQRDATPLDAWRRGKSQSPTYTRTEGSPRLVVLVHG
jgi:hypothetical protein